MPDETSKRQLFVIQVEPSGKDKNGLNYFFVVKKFKSPTFVG